jgi:DNA end-binding protein Ku
MWRGVIRAGRQRVPVKLYAAVQDRTVHFRLLHASDRTPVRQRLVDPSTNEAVATSDVRRGYEVERGVFVVLTEEELDALEPGASRDIHVTHVVDRDALDGRWYERPYWLTPDGDAAGAYFALAEALGTGRQALVRWVMRGRAYVGALRADGGYLQLHVLRHADEVVSEQDLEPPAGRTPDAREIRLAEQLVAALAGDFRPERYHDEYHARVCELIAAKAKGRRPPRRRAAPRRETESLARALSASLRRTGRRRSHG